MKILVVDDQAGSRRALGSYLESLEHQVVLVSSGREALDDPQLAEYDAIFTDLKMEGIDGIDLTREVKTRYPAAQLILITAYAEVDSAVSAMKAGALDYLKKPINPGELEAVLTRLEKVSSLEKEVCYLKKYLGISREMPEIIAHSQEMKELLADVARVAQSQATCMVYGESGTGKEVIVALIHRLSSLKDRPLVKVNCAALPEALIESELFGYSRGAFTGAVNKRLGLFKTAADGIIFLDEIGELPLAVQAKLLRVLESGEYTPLGQSQPEVSRARVVAATNRDLSLQVQEGSFREDLFFRLNIVPLTIPTLRQRKVDIIPLAEFFLKQFCQQENKTVSFSTAVLNRLASYDWPGNVRQLKNLTQRLVIIARQNLIELADLPEEFQTITEKQQKNETTGSKNQLEMVDENWTLAKLEKWHIQNVLAKNQYQLGRAAEKLGIHRNTLSRKIKDYDLI